MEDQDKRRKLDPVACLQDRGPISGLPLALSIEGVQRETGLGRTLIYDAIRTGKLAARKAGRRTVILREELEFFLATLPRAKQTG